MSQEGGTGDVLRFPKLGKRLPGEIADLNAEGILDNLDAVDNAISIGGPVAVEKTERLSPDEIASGLISKYENDPAVAKGVEFRIPKDKEKLSALLEDFLDLPSRYPRRYMYLVALAYEGSEDKNQERATG
ncbi:hypothetical protein A3H16_00920 [Candidatus Kaiserbacteria bacterium RIFCSPLOWO2_12_FULL_53_8]|uniref:Uncharacterized protein n=1 Tax=Candidatus Kaiserbacteria bacterium RIFCSPLOWO2_12_FULL_53_8 TaxID=1798529 RepID=A0A1F6G2D7_9BACT|nr:MAG: hypothetical protein A3H16_00920 [Candidatus Kaiserbacteria bacterium RIFCSPLOWO2_12_FULL_53_8]